MKFLIILPSTQRGGVEEYSLRIASSAIKKGWDVHVAFPNTEGTTSLIQDFTSKGVQYHSLEIADSGNTTLIQHLVNLSKTIFLLLHIKPNVVQIVLPGIDTCFGSILACGFLRVPTLVRFGLVVNRYSFSAKKLKAYTWARSRNQQWITVSENNRSLVCESFQIEREQVLCIYNGFSLKPDLYTNNQEENVSLRYQILEELGLSTTNKLLLTVARLHEQKGYIFLIHTIPYIAKEFPEVRFVWVGEGEQKEYLLSKVQEYGVEDKVLFLGYRSDIPNLLKSADFFVFPTLYEGHPNALLEAMAYGLQIITSDASSIPETIKHKVHGLLFRTGDSCNLLENIRWALKHPKEMKEMSHNAKLHIINDFSEDKMMKETFKILHKLSERAQKKNHDYPINSSL
ncbi:glycosyl transferase family 1 [Nostoc sp. T09]|uniref:glycosyltransferase family 4 protein n=1 Tax=Nostoc sp. T09 TaxID=1932621 RepID=UPI000A38ADFC|nr:glycosyltransferase family 4 protein [Nostoc sp. T09]OUL36827.1 glycosyl transferase family 1 [Nostoc sp. T09]